MRNWTRLPADRRGATAAVFAIAMPVLVGMGALAVDVGIWNVQKRQAQGAADQAAFSAAVAAKAGNTSANAAINARAITAGMGFVDGENGVAVTVTNPPAQGQFAGNSGYWEVMVEEPQATWLAGYLFGGEATVRARAVAGRASGGNACIIALAPSANCSVDVKNNAKISNAGCAVYVNSTSNTALCTGNSSNTTIAASTYVAGNWTPGNNAQITGQVNAKGIDPIADPYAEVTVAPPASCTQTAAVTSGTISPGRYCGGINVANHSTVTLQPGTYFIDTQLTLGTKSVLKGSSVTVILRPDTSRPNFSIQTSPSQESTIELTAPGSGAYQGIAMMSLNTLASAPTFNNNLTMNIQGALYFPTQVLTLNNNLNASMCTQLVASRVILNNNANMFYNCPGFGIRSPGGSSIALME